MSRRRTLAAISVAAAVLVGGSHTVSADATPSTSGGGGAGTLRAGGPPPGKAWLVGQITDQAAHPLQDVNVEAWSDDPGATAPVASDLTYENLVDGKQGYFRLEVPIHAYYRIVVSADPNDPYRTFQYHDGEPIKVGTRKVRKLGTTAVARVALQPSRTSATINPGRVKVGQAARITVTVTCRNVDPVLGKVTAAVGGKKVAGTLKQASRGKVTLTLPKLRKPGRYAVAAWYLGDSYVKKSTTASKLTLVVHK